MDPTSEKTNNTPVNTPTNRHIVKENKIPTSWTCKPIDMTMEEIDKLEIKTFVPYGGTNGCFDISKVADQ
jgi:hypothetical protein